MHTSAEYLTNPAASKSTIVDARECNDTPVPPYVNLVTGHYHIQDTNYSARRTKGTNDWLVLGTVAGRGRFGTGARRLVVEQGQFVLIRPGIPHDYGALSTGEEWEFYWAHFHPRAHWQPLLNWPGHNAGVLLVSITDPKLWTVVEADLQNMNRFTASGNYFAQELAMHSLESVLLKCAESTNAERIGIDDRIQHVQGYIESNLSKALTVPLLASELSLSPSRFAHLFQDALGLAPMVYVDVRRMLRAKILLTRSSNSISQIASEIGLSPIYFSNRFKKVTGQSPSHYRSEGRK